MAAKSTRSKDKDPAAILEGLPGILKVENQGEKTIVYGMANGLPDSSSIVTGIVNRLSEKGVLFSDLRTELPDLEDVFLTLTGRPMGEERSV